MSQSQVSRRPAHIGSRTPGETRRGRIRKVTVTQSGGAGHATASTTREGGDIPNQTDDHELAPLSNDERLHDPTSKIENRLAGPSRLDQRWPGIGTEITQAAAAGAVPDQDSAARLARLLRFHHRTDR